MAAVGSRRPPDACRGLGIIQDQDQNKEMIDEETTQRFWSMTIPSDTRSYNGTPCLEWTGPLHAGYGNFGGMSTHRYLWIMILNRSPRRRELHHLCQNKACVNSEHLALMTRKQHRAWHKVVDRRLKAKKKKELRANANQLQPGAARKLRELVEGQFAT
jgi:hypothetical protein